MKALYVLGNPVAHSRSPVFQNAALKAAGLPEVYTTREVDDAGMRLVADELRRGETTGCNVTLPHKELAARLADRRTLAVEHTGVANTWWVEDGALWADNTDIFGLQMSYGALLGATPAREVVILGAGGAAQAALYSVAELAERVTIVNRTLARAEESFASASAWLPASVTREALAWPSSTDDAQAVNAALRGASLVIQTTSIPVLKPGDEAPFAALAFEEIGGGEGALVELVYSDQATVPMRRAAAGGVRVLDGATMLLHQGARSFERWTGLRPDILRMRDALADALGRPRAKIAAEISEDARAVWGAAR